MLELNHLMISFQSMDTPPGGDPPEHRHTRNITPKRLCEDSKPAKSTYVSQLQQHLNPEDLQTHKSVNLDTDPNDPLFQKRPMDAYPLFISMDGGSVTGGMRALLYNWMVLVASDHQFTRDTYGLATSYMDMFFLKRPSVPKDQLQVLGFAAVGLAAKVQENKSILNLESLFQKADIIRFQLEIVRTLGWRLNPDTHVHWTKLLMSSWDVYIEGTKHKYKNCIFLAKNQISFTLSREFFEISDCINLHDKGGSWDKEEWSKNLFYVLTRKHAESVPFSSDLKTFIKEFYKQDNFRRYFNDFIKATGLGHFSPNREIGSFIFKFLTLEISYEAADFQTESWNQYISIQTYNKNMYSHVVKILKQ